MSTRDVIGRQRSYLHIAKRRLMEAMAEIDDSIAELQNSCGSMNHIMKDVHLADGFVRRCDTCWVTEDIPPPNAEPTEETKHKTWIQVCKFCDEEIYGGKGDYWHVANNNMVCGKNGVSQMAAPTVVSHD